MKTTDQIDCSVSPNPVSSKVESTFHGSAVNSRKTSMQEFPMGRCRLPPVMGFHPDTLNPKPRTQSP